MIEKNSILKKGIGIESEKYHFDNSGMLSEPCLPPSLRTHLVMLLQVWV